MTPVFALGLLIGAMFSVDIANGCLSDTLWIRHSTASLAAWAWPC